MYLYRTRQQKMTTFRPGTTITQVCKCWPCAGWCLVSLKTPGSYSGDPDYRVRISANFVVFLNIATPYKTLGHVSTSLMTTYPFHPTVSTICSWYKVVKHQRLVSVHDGFFLPSRHVLKLMRFHTAYSTSLFIITLVNADFLMPVLVFTSEWAQQDISLCPIIFPRRRFFTCLQHCTHFTSSVNKENALPVPASSSRIWDETILLVGQNSELTFDPHER